MAASTMAKCFPLLVFRHSTRVSRTPALPVIERPGSRIISKRAGASSATTAAKSSTAGAGSPR